jgi:AraC-like DNA-binding protein
VLRRVARIGAQQTYSWHESTASLTDLRIELARDLLLGSSETAKQVARRTGYKSDAAFNRAFTRHHGCSPGQWRRDHIIR